MAEDIIFVIGFVHSGRFKELLPEENLGSALDPLYSSSQGDEMASIQGCSAFIHSLFSIVGF